MLKSAVLGVVLLNFIILLACTRVQVEILHTAGATEKRTPPKDKEVDPSKLLQQDPVRRGGPGAALRSDFIVLTQGGGTPCATDRNVTPAVRQETGVWCWAASAQGVMSFHNVNRHQCGIVNKVMAEDAMDEDGTTPLCCANNFVTQCQRNGWTDQVFDSFGIDYRWLEGSLTQRQVAGQICGNGPFTYSIAYEGGGGHTFVVKDYWMDEEEGMSLWVDTHESFRDTMGNLLPSSFKSRPYKEYAEGSYDGTSNKVDFTYVLIKPQD